MLRGHVAFLRGHARSVHGRADVRVVLLHALPYELRGALHVCFHHDDFVFLCKNEVFCLCLKETIEFKVQEGGGEREREKREKKEERERDKKGKNQTKKNDKKLSKQTTHFCCCCC